MSDITKLYEDESNVDDIAESTELLDVQNNIEIPTLEIVNEYEALLSIVGYNNELEELTLESDSLIDLSNTATRVYDSLNIAQDEVSNIGTLTTETATMVNNSYNQFVDMLDTPSISKLSLESAIAFKKEYLWLTTESANNKSFIEIIKNKIILFIKSVYNKLVEWSTRLAFIATRQEVSANNLANYITDNVDTFKIDKWEYLIPVPDIIGNFTILKDFSVNSLEKYIDFNNGGFQSEKLMRLFESCASKNDMSDFKELKGIPIDYDLKAYFKEYSNVVTVPIDVSGKTAFTLLSHVVDGKRVLERKRIPLIVDPAFKSSLKTKGILTKEQMINILRTTAKAVTRNKSNLNVVYGYMKKINSIALKLNESSDKVYVSDLMRCSSLLVSSISMSTRVGLLSNGFIIGVIARMAKLYKKKKQIKR